MKILIVFLLFLAGLICINHAFYIGWLGSFPNISDTEWYRNRFYIFLSLGIVFIIFSIVLFIRKDNKKQ